METTTTKHLQNPPSPPTKNKKKLGHFTRKRKPSLYYKKKLFAKACKI